VNEVPPDKWLLPPVFLTIINILIGEINYFPPDIWWELPHSNTWQISGGKYLISPI